jgi:hypothetical protein
MLIVLLIVDKSIGLRFSEEQETQGLDVSQHGDGEGRRVLLEDIRVARMRMRALMRVGPPSRGG